MRILFFLFLLTCLSPLALSQGKVVPLSNNFQQELHSKKYSNLKITADTNSYDLPFFDDFSASHITVDTSRWVPGSGVYVGNNFAINPPTYNVATFDGLNANGQPYNITTPSAVGPADNLTSKRLDLSKYKSKDSVYLRFFWQGDGIGDYPDIFTDSIILQFKNRSNVWNTVWKETTDSSGFNLQRIAVDSAQYYHKAFQFRFQSYGRLSGMYDIWNIDYILLDTGRLAKDNWSPDLSFSGPPTHYLKNYTAMPIKQFITNRSGEIAPNVSVKLVNLVRYLRDYNFPDSLNTLSDVYAIPHDTLDVLTTITGLFPAAKPPQKDYYYNSININYTTDPSVIDSTIIPRILKIQFWHTPGGDPVPGKKYLYTVSPDSAISRINTTINDSISNYTYLTDFYACDDGTAEGAYGINSDFGKVAVRYDLNAPDTLTYISICLPKVYRDFTNEPITLMVWTGISEGSPSSTLLYQQDIVIKYPNAVNTFQKFQLPYPGIILNQPGPVWIGYQQYRNEFMYIAGFDRNTDHSDRIYYNVTNAWQKETLEKGSLMIRAGFKNQYITGTEKPRTTAEELAAEVYPNPTHGELNIKAKIQSAKLYDVSGRLLLSEHFDGYVYDLHTLDISNLPNGLYLLHLENEEARAVRKIVLSR